MKKISLLVFATILVFTGFAQQFPLQSQYQFNYPTINPAASGENDFYRVRTSFREQWVGLTQNPISTQILTVTKGFNNNGLGVTVFNDKTGGAFNKSGASISYSHKVKFKSSDFYFGVSGGASKINLSPIDDPALLTNNDLIPEFTFGAYYIINDIKLGVSIPGLLNANMELSGSNQNTIDRHLYTMISYKKELSEDWSIYPSILLKTTKNHNQIDANVNFKVKDRLWFGTSYRSDFGLSLFVGIDFGRLLSIYSHDISTNEAANYSNGSHELTLGYDFIYNVNSEKVIKEEKLFLDKDGDGVEDSVDVCPDDYGDANGCPDFDKDGIPDKYDLCPHLYGSASVQGCPELTRNEEQILTTALGDLKFGYDKDEIDYKSYTGLTNLAILMHSNPEIFLFIEGFASSEGSEKYNLSLSARRVKAVQKFLNERGIDRNRLVIDFHGEDTPLNANLTNQERAENRRVEFDIRYHLSDSVAVANLKNEYDSIFNGIYTTIIPEENKDLIEVEEEIIEPEVKEVEVDSLLPNEIIEPEVKGVEVDSLLLDDESSKYLVIVQVFNDVANAVEFTSNNSFKYIFFKNKYYIYAFESKKRVDAEKFRDEYKKDCWILDRK